MRLPVPQRVAVFLLSYGAWALNEPVLVFDQSTPVVEISYNVVNPPGGRESYGLISIGTWSQLLSARYLSLTSSAGGARAFTPNLEPTDLGPAKVPPQWKGVDLSIDQLRLGEEVQPGEL